ncbi:thiamine-phosphate kinase [Sulfolobus sp. E11-6]|uniref:thiamine-phosphate kinase n=1 Tax=Sulfolobus sp. E11-6 TaxID=2663020 RepID=UPI0012964FB2|nr:thiamine-monophosphate kinase [Sulfolobus sp. E11-6]QGA67791.1 thiamine-monophosphate kinase [Sulfolobus sp. E11-6]
MKLKDIGEHEFIKRYIKSYIDIKLLDDVFINDKRGYKVDGFKLSYAFPFMSLYDIGWKAISASTSDIIAKGVKPEFYLISLGLPHDFDVNKAEELISGISDAIHYYGGRYVGGDLNDSDSNGWVDVFVEGEVLCDISDKVIDDGDLLVIGDYIGYTTNVFISYINNFNIQILPESLLKVKHPIIKKSLLFFMKKYCKFIKYSTDISDGLMVSLYKIVDNFNLGINITEIPIDKNVLNSLKLRLNLTELDILKYAGEEFLPLLIIDKNSPVKEILTELQYLAFNPLIIGQVIRGNKLITYKNTVIKNTGWDNFIGWY